ncbi:MAG: cytochrome c biogenesis protein CcdA [Paracoccaceae bacterium]
MVFDISYWGAALAGILSFFSPCILPIVPFYLCYMAGISIQELNEEEQISAGAKRRLIWSSVFFAAGVVTIFVTLGLIATSLGQVFRQYFDELSWVAAGILFIFGLHFLGVLKISMLYREARVDSSNIKPASYVGSYLIGLAFGFGWTPCVGPALAAILYMAGQSDSLVHGAGLLFIYGTAMTTPFILAAIFSGPFLRWVQRNRKYMGHVEKVMGGFLILFAILIVTGKIPAIAQFLLDAFPTLFTYG